MPTSHLRVLLTAVVLAGLAPTTSGADAPGAPDLDAAAARIIDGTNVLRREQGLAAVQPDATLMQTAAGFARHMADNDRYGHEADGRTPVQRASAQGYRHCMLAENIAFERRPQGFTTAGLAASLVQGWTDSPPHRHNMLAPDVTQTGVAVAHSARSNRYYAVQLFGRPLSQQMSFEVVNGAGGPVAYRMGDERLSLPPRAVNTHTVCGATRLTLPRGGEWRQVDARDGERYTIDAPARKPAAAK
jgi:uncharacterized protein YkwD